MKYLFVFFAAIAIASASKAQRLATTTSTKAQYSDIAPYQRDSTMPNFRLLREDSTWLLTRKLPEKQPVVFIFFNPGCPHCQHETDSLVKYMDEMKNVNFIFTTFSPTFKEIDSFATVHGLTEFKNVHLTKDPNYQLGSFYRMTMVPFVALYKDGRLVKTWTSNAPPKEIMDYLKD
jgi:thiol-disulfide isomerase/thioredoxin